MRKLKITVPEEVVKEVDKLISAGVFKSRAGAVREALTQLIDIRRREEIGRQIVEGYKRIPQTDDELRWAEVAGREMVAEEPW
jgi:Arc/MetJ-type ribon-helix-helix transcriptional regulator